CCAVFAAAAIESSINSPPFRTALLHAKNGLTMTFAASRAWLDLLMESSLRWAGPEQAPCRRALRRRKNVNHPAGDVLFRLRRVRRHVRSRGMRLERVHAFPFLDHDEGVRAVLGLNGQRGIGVDRGAVLDAALLGAH